MLVKATFVVCGAEEIAVTAFPLAPLDEQLCFALYATSMAITRTYKPLLDAMGVTYPQYLMLSAVGRDAATVGAIAVRLDLSPSTITPPLQRLEKAGLVTRQRTRPDEREVEVRLTATGLALLERSRCLGAVLLERTGMTHAQADALTREVQALRAALIAKAAPAEAAPRRRRPPTTPSPRRRATR